MHFPCRRVTRRPRHPSRRTRTRAYLAYARDTSRARHAHGTERQTAIRPRTPSCGARMASKDENLALSQCTHEAERLATRSPHGHHRDAVGDRRRALRQREEDAQRRHGPSRRGGAIRLTSRHRRCTAPSRKVFEPVPAGEKFSSANLINVSALKRTSRNVPALHCSDRHEIMNAACASGGPVPPRAHELQGREPSRPRPGRENVHGKGPRAYGGRACLDAPVDAPLH